MHPFATYVLQSYYKATGWNEDNLYGNLTRSSTAILDFTVPRGLHLGISKSPNALFKTTYTMNAMPSLNGSVGYIFSSCDLDIKSSGDVRFKNMLERFKIYDQPRRPEGKEEEWLAGKRVDTRDYLLYGRYYLPNGRLDAVYTTRLSSSLQAIIAAISEPPSGFYTDIRSRPNNASNLMVTLQHDMGKWCTEYSYSAEDEMWGLKVLHNFGKVGGPTEAPEESVASVKPKRVDEEEPVEGGLRGRVSAGAEFFFSAKERSAGVSTGIRFTTLPDATPPSFQTPSVASETLSATSPLTSPQPPTTITALFNPMLGHFSSAYTARVSRDLSLSSRFNFNVYSFESEWTMGAEWWQRRSPEPIEDSEDMPPALSLLSKEALSKQEVNGVVKARVSTSNDVSLMWEGRLRNMLVSLGVVSDFSSRVKPIKAVGLEVSYFGSG